MSGGSMDVLARVGDAEPRIVSLQLAGADEASVAIAIQIDRSTVSLTFTADRFLSFAEKLQRFAASMPGRPS